MKLEFLKDIELIIWDWNGTLLNDVDFCVECMNKVLTKYNYDTITVEKYREIFTFPVKEYYSAVGFNFNVHPFEMVGMEYIYLYNEGLQKAELQPNATKVVNYFREKNIKQVVISAREHDSLQNDIKMTGIYEYFDTVQGISNNYANGKAELFEDYFSKNKIDKEKVVLIGDTVHDCEIAHQFGLHFIQMSKGHQNISHFSEFEDIVSISDLSELIK